MAYAYAHMCRDDHVQIGHNDSGGDERCPLCRARDESERLRAAVEDAIETLEAMDVHDDNPLYDRLRGVLESEGVAAEGTTP